MVLSFILISILAVLIAVLFRKIAKINKYVDDLFNMQFMAESIAANHDERLDAHFRDIVTLSKSLDILEQQVNKYHTNEVKDAQKEYVSEAVETNQVSAVNERRAKFAEYRKQGMDVKSAGVAVGVHYSTAKRYEKWRKDNKK